MKRFYPLFLAILFLCAVAFAASDTTGTSAHTQQYSERSTMVRETVTITSDSSGDYVGTLNLFGSLLRVAFDPQAASPTTGYDLTLTGADAVDVMIGNGANLSATVTSSAFIADATRPMGFPLAGSYTLTGADMGASKQTTLYLWIKR